MIKDKKIKDQPGLVKRDASIINTDKDAYLAALKRRERENLVENLAAKTQELEEKVDSIDEKLNLILSLLKEK